MDFSDALKAMKEGKKVKMTHYKPGFYLTISIYQIPGSPVCRVKRFCISNGNTKEYVVLSVGDILADDWEIVEDTLEAEVHTKIYVKCPKCNAEVELGNYNNIFCGFCEQEIKPKVKKVKPISKSDDIEKLINIMWFGVPEL